MKLMECELTSVAAEGAGHFRARFTNLERRQQIVDVILTEPPALIIGRRYEIVVNEIVPKAAV